MDSRAKKDIARLRPWAKWMASRGMWWVVAGLSFAIALPVAAVSGAWEGACDTAGYAFRSIKKDVCRLRDLAPTIRDEQKGASHGQ